MRLFAGQEGLGPQVATAPFEIRASHFLVLAVVPPIKLVALLSIATRNDTKDCIKMRVYMTIIAHDMLSPPCV